MVWGQRGAGFVAVACRVTVMAQVTGITPSDLGGSPTEDVFKLPAFLADQAWRQRNLHNWLLSLTRAHYRACPPYRNIITGMALDLSRTLTVEELPFLPVGLFKTLELRSVPENQITRTLVSTGTSGAGRARVFIDRDTSLGQMRALSRIVGDVIGHQPMPVLIIDTVHAPADPAHAARMTAIGGFSMFGAGRPTYALKDDMTPDLNVIQRFLDAVQGRRFLVFGFTYVIWHYFLRCLDAIEHCLDFSRAEMIHGGGWKKLQADNVDDARFDAEAARLLGLPKTINYYGMTEQPGSIFIRCAHGRFHCSLYSDIIIRRPDLSVAEIGEQGIIQTLSMLPKSYPGHSLLTDDLGVLLGQDDCPCGRKGKSFQILGRLPTAEAKGCGDTYVAPPPLLATQEADRHVYA